MNFASEYVRSYNNKLLTGDSLKNKWTKFFRSTIFIPSAVVLGTFFGAACFLRLYELMRDRFNGRNNAAAQANTPTATSSATPDGDNYLKVINSCTELLVLNDENQGPSVAGGTHMSCSICLEEYVGKDTVRNLIKCGHYFHAECIDQWLIKNTTCPVCRIPFLIS